jgi:DinB superfamily
MWQEAGFFKGAENVQASLKQLEQYIDTIPGRYIQFQENNLLERTAPGKWSRKEILGHLIDSAINNLKRFTDIQHTEQPYIIQSYKQNELVAENNYQELPLNHLLQLWQSLNRQIVFVARQIPAEKLNYLVQPQYNNGEMKTLGWLIADYVAHMEHHWKQVFG